MNNDSMQQKTSSATQTQVVPDKVSLSSRTENVSLGVNARPNRQIIETRKKQIISKNQATVNIEIGEDLRLENFYKRSSASQTEPDRFQETRLLSPSKLQQQSIEAMKRKEQLHKELLAKDSESVNE